MRFILFLHFIALMIVVQKALSMDFEPLQGPGDTAEQIEGQTRSTRQRITTEHIRLRKQRQNAKYLSKNRAKVTEKYRESRRKKKAERTEAETLEYKARTKQKYEETKAWKLPVLQVKRLMRTDEEIAEANAERCAKEKARISMMTEEEKALENLENRLKDVKRRNCKPNIETPTYLEKHDALVNKALKKGVIDKDKVRRLADDVRYGWTPGRAWQGLLGPEAQASTSQIPGS